MNQQQLALKVREHVIRMAGGGGCFLGASLSCTDLIVHLYTSVLRVTPATKDDPNRDYLMLSKGHDVPALYGTLAELGWFPTSRLARHLDPDDTLYWHPNRNVPGVEFHSGSLGHLLSVAAGVAYDMKRAGTNNRVFVILGDGECDEGSVWEACLVAAAKKLDNLVAIVDRNHFQANLATEELIPLEPMGPKFEAFGWRQARVNGHDYTQLAKAFEKLPYETGKPTVVIADTVRNKGLPSLEGKAERWFVKLTPAEIEQCLAELHGAASAGLTSEPLVVR
ncbi:MAG: transketolase [Deltaproteobacteria bacterium]|nr:transketolase [Deltaproteobacteria bacterium]MCW5806411.1 transketolase [Deltaproteobacteria bacterium]